jgi:hypothetical protein
VGGSTGRGGEAQKLNCVRFVNNKGQMPFERDLYCVTSIIKLLVDPYPLCPADISPVRTGEKSERSEVEWVEEVQNPTLQGSSLLHKKQSSPPSAVGTILVSVR